MAFKAGDIVFEISGDIKGLNDAMGAASRSVQKNFGDISGFVGKAMAGIGLAMTGAVVGVGYQALSAAEEVNKAATRMAASLGLPAEEAERFKDMIREVYGNNFGDSLTDVGQAIQEVALALQRVGVTSNDEITAATESAIMLRDAFQIEVGESVNAVAGLMQNFGLSSQQAFDFVAAGMQRGLNASGDFLDSIGEYSTQFANGGATAEQFFAIMEQGMQSGMLGTDKAADAFKEFRVRLLDGSKLTAESMAMIGLNIEEITARINAGTLTTADAWTLVINALAATSNEAVQLQAGVGLIGTQFEDLGAKTVLNMNMATEGMKGLGGATASLSEQYKNLGDNWEGVKRKMVLAGESIGQALIPVLSRILDAMAPVIESFAAWITANPELAASLGALAGAVGVVLTVVGGILMVLPGLVTGWTLVSGAVTAVGAVFAALGAAIGAPVAIVVGAIAAIVAAAIGMYYYWEQIKAALIAIWQAIASAWMYIWGPIIDGINWLANVGLGVLQKAQSLMGMGGGGGGMQMRGGPQQNMSARGGGGEQGGGGMMGGGSTINMNFMVSGADDPGTISRTIAELVHLELRARGI